MSESRVHFFTCKPYEVEEIRQLAPDELDVTMHNTSLAMALQGNLGPFEVAVIHSKDLVDASTISTLKNTGVGFLQVRASGYNNIDVDAAREVGMIAANTPAYSPVTIAEHALAMALSLLKRIPETYQQMNCYDFTLDQLVGRNLSGMKVGVLGVGAVGKAFVRLLKGFNCEVFGFDSTPDDAFASEVGMRYSDLEDVLSQSDVVSIHLPLNDQTKGMIDAQALKSMKPASLLINTGRGKIVDSQAVMEALRSGHLSGFGMDVYDGEENIFFEDHSNEPMGDEILKAFCDMPQVLVTGHKAFLTQDALKARTAMIYDNIQTYLSGRRNECFLT